MKERRNMKTVQISVRLDESLKNEFDIFCKQANITVKYAVETFIFKTIEGKKIPYKVERFMKNNIENSDSVLKSGKGRIGIEVSSETQRRFQEVCMESGYGMGMVIRIFMWYCVKNGFKE
jgi:addiction module RelB/DinJ family antitoxin